VAARDRFNRHETDIVAVADIARTGITEANEKQHVALSALPPHDCR
jgi:hypothetical protein